VPVTYHIYYTNSHSSVCKLTVHTAITQRHSASHAVHLLYKYTLQSLQLNCTYSIYTQKHCLSRSNFNIQIHTSQSATELFLQQLHTDTVPVTHHIYYTNSHYSVCKLTVLTAITHRNSASHAVHLLYKYTLHSLQLNCTYSNYTQTQCQSRSTLTVQIHTAHSAT
jgi:hypothetical protein